MASANTTTFDPVFKEFYLPYFIEQYDRQTPLMDEVIMKRDSEHVENLSAFVAMEWETWAGTGSRDEEEEFPTPEPGDYQRTEIPLRFHYAAFRVTGQLLEASKTDAAAFVPALQREMKSKITSFHKHENRMLWGDGAGVLCQVDGTPTAGDLTLTVDNAYGISNAINGHMFLSKNVHIDIYSAKSSGVLRRTFKITSVTRGSGSSTSATVELDTAPEAAGVVDGDYVFLESSINKEMMGLLGIIDTNNFVTTLQGLAYGDHPDWGAQIRQGATAGTAEGLTLLRMMLLANDIAFTGGGNTNIIMCSPGIQLTYAMMCKREGIPVAKATLGTGWTGLEFLYGDKSIPVIPDKYAPGSRMAYIDAETLRMYELARPQWLDRGEGILQRIGRTEVYEAVYMHYVECGILKRMANGMLEDITELS